MHFYFIFYFCSIITFRFVRNMCVYIFQKYIIVFLLNPVQNINLCVKCIDLFTQVVKVMLHFSSNYLKVCDIPCDNTWAGVSKQTNSFNMALFF